MSTRVLILLFWLVAGTARAAPVDDWYASPDAKLVIVLLDGFVDGFVDELDPEHRPLMPAVRAWLADATRFTDVLATETHARRAREQLRAELESFGEVEWVRGDAGTLASIRSFAATTGRRALVLDPGWLEPKLRFDPGILHRIDPAPWGQGTSRGEIGELRVDREERAAVLASLTGPPNPNDPELVRDTRWLVAAAHGSIDAPLGEWLAAATGAGCAVILTATSSTGLGEREALGPGIGAGLDVAHVPVYLRLPGAGGGVDEGPRKWISITPAWFARPVTSARMTWASPPDGRDGWPAICELRWTTDEFTLIDSAQPARPPRLFDRLLDPGEWLDRGIDAPALADSLRSNLRATLYGRTPTLVFQAGDEPVDLALSISVTRGKATPATRVHLEAGETTRVQLRAGAENVGLGGYHPVRIGGEEFLLDELVVHSPAWRALLRDPRPGPDLTIWLE